MKMLLSLITVLASFAANASGAECELKAINAAEDFAIKVLGVGVNPVKTTIFEVGQGDRKIKYTVNVINGDGSKTRYIEVEVSDSIECEIMEVKQHE